MAPNVLMLGWELPPYNSGGLGEACLGLAKALVDKGVNLTFVLPRKVDIKIDGLNLVFANVDEETLSNLTTYTHSTEWSSIFHTNETPPDFVRGALQYAKNINKIAKKHNADVIHSHDWMTYPAAIAAKRCKKKPLVAHVHSTEFDRTGGHNPNPHVYKIEREGLLRADRVLPVGGFMKKVLVDKYAVDPDKINVVYNGIAEGMDRYLPPALTTFKKMGYKVVLFLGRITLQKGPEYFVRAAKVVSEFDDKVLFVVTGSGDMQEYMISEAARLGIMDKFLFTGFVRGDDRDRIFKAADLYVMPSVSEPFGITALESVALGTPVLISKQSGVAEILNNALKTDFWDIEEMANKILAVLKYSALPYDLSTESTKEVKNFTWEKAADKVIDVYNQLLI